MNVKSRAQLIVWCLPHLGFVESEAKIEATTTQAAPQAAAQTIPAGNATVGGVSILPGQRNDIIGNRGGNSDVGMGA